MNLKMEAVSFFETSVTIYHTRRGHDPAYRNTNVMTDTIIAFVLPNQRQIKGSEVAILKLYNAQPFHRTINES
jgi:hypothetical protein